MPKNPTKTTQNSTGASSAPSSLLLIAAIFIAVILSIAAFIFGRPVAPTPDNRPGLEQPRNPEIVKPGSPELEESIDPSLLDEGVACSADAKICPDGSAVGRSAPNCEFAPCPGE